MKVWNVYGYDMLDEYGKDCSLDREKVILIADHVAEMREVLEALQDNIDQCGIENMTFKLVETFDKYAHYLEEK